MKTYEISLQYLPDEMKTDHPSQSAAASTGENMEGSRETQAIAAQVINNSTESINHTKPSEEHTSAKSDTPETVSQPADIQPQ